MNSLKRSLLGKLTREHLDSFVASNATDRRTLIIGSANGKYLEHFPNRTSFDIRKSEFVDVVGDAHELPFEDEGFEMVVCTEVLEHLHTPQRALDEMWRVLRPGGKLIMSTRFIAPIHDAPGDYFRFTKYGLAHLLRKWRSVFIEEEMTTMGTIGHILQRIAYQTDLRGGAVSKAFVLWVARLAGKFDFLIKREYGVRNRYEIREEGSIMTSGYYVIAER